MNGENGHTRTQTKSRIKRHRMEQMSKMYSKYKLQRGTADLYETMIQCYAESFEIKLEGQDGGSTSSSNRNSFKKSEILMNRDLVLKELADTENTYVDSLEFLVEVRFIFVIARGWENKQRKTFLHTILECVNKITYQCNK